MVFIITFSFLNQILWCDPHWNCLSETIPMSGNIIGFGWEIRKLAFWKLSILDLICCPGVLLKQVYISVEWKKKRLVLFYHKPYSWLLSGIVISLLQYPWFLKYKNSVGRFQVWLLKDYKTLHSPHAQSTPLMWQKYLSKNIMG